MKSSSLLPRPNKSHLKRPRSWMAICLSVSTTILAVVFALGIYSGTAYAGLFSFVESFFESSKASAKTPEPVNAQSSQTIALLQAAVNQDPNPNKVSNVAPIADNTLIPDIAATNDASDEDQSSAKISSYVVRQGDTVSGIAKMFSVSVSTVLWANNLSSRSVLRAGQTLIILPVTGISYVVKKGDTVESIAKKYKADPDDIATYNDLSVTALAVGQTIIVPDAEIPTVAPSGYSIHRKVVVGNEPLLDDISAWPSYPNYYIRPLIGGSLTQGLHGHNAVDIGAPVGTPIYAAAAGTVIISRINGGYNGGYGNYVVIEHNNGTQTLYAHMQSRRMVSSGQAVGQGQVIGYVGLSGMTTGAHLHFEVRLAQNPGVNW